MQILKYEIRKILYKKISIISLILLGVWMVTMLFSCLSNTTFVNSEGIGNSGTKAVKLLRNEKMKWNGSLTVETIGRVIRENTRIESDNDFTGMKESDIKLSNIKYSRKQGFMDIRDIINCSYGELQSYDYYLIDSLRADVAYRFYSNRIDQLKALLDSQEADHLTKNEKQYLINSAETLSIPFNYSYADGWLIALERSATVIFAIAFVICIIMAPVFSIEYQTGSDAILLSTEHGRKRGILYKLIAGLLSTSIVYWITTCAVFGFIFAVYGTEGGNCEIQTSVQGWKSFYHITNSQALWMVLLLGYLGCLFISSLAMFLSSKVKSSFATIIFLVLIILVPSTIGKQVITGGLWDKLLSLLPHQMLLGWTLVRIYKFYDVFGIVITPYQILPILYGLLSAILLPFAYSSFRKHKLA